jgi:pyrimidine-nucleoside phosphorylase
MDVRDLIRRKRDGGELAPREVGAVVSGLVEGDVDAEQVAALLMAGVIRGFSRSEVVALTSALAASGRVLDLGSLPGRTVDKHSTGGVGDTTSLVACPVLAACGLMVVKLSGRSLGHTGGTIDKLESIPGLRTDLNPDRLLAQVREVGVAIAAATADLAPADARLYAIRDATDTVDDPGLIAASVMSKKIAGGAENIVLDVKTGGGAFLPEEEDALRLAELCVAIGRESGRRVVAVVSDMSQPLGPAAGNALEVAAAVRVLRGEPDGRLARLARELAVHALVLTGQEPAAAAAAVEASLRQGTALERFRALVAAQGGDPRVVDDPWEILPRAPVRRDWLAGPGVVRSVDCRGLGMLVGSLGATRIRRGADVDPRVGLEVLVSVGDALEDGVPAVRVHAATDDDAHHALRALDGLLEIGPGEVSAPQLVRRIVDGETP